MLSTILPEERTQNGRASLRKEDSSPLFLGGRLVGRGLRCRGSSGLGDAAGLGLGDDLGLLYDGGGLDFGKSRSDSRVRMEHTMVEVLRALGLAAALLAAVFGAVLVAVFLGAALVVVSLGVAFLAAVLGAAFYEFCEQRAANPSRDGDEL